MVSVTIAVLAMTAMHEEVHERASQQQQIRKDPQQVRTMFREKEEANDREKYDQHNAPSRAEPTAIF
jgi:hypothetical protein